MQLLLATAFFLLATNWIRNWIQLPPRWSIGIALVLTVLILPVFARVEATVEGFLHWLPGSTPWLLVVVVVLGAASAYAAIHASRLRRSGRP